MAEIIVTSQEQLNNIPVDYDGRIIISFGTSYDRAVVHRTFKYSVVEVYRDSCVIVWGSNSVIAYENSSVIAREDSGVIAYDNSVVIVCENSSVAAWEDSSVIAYDNSVVKAYGNSSVAAWGNSYVEAWENSQITDRQINGTIITNGNARIVYDPKTIDEYLAAHDLATEGKTCLLYKAVHKHDGKYVSDYDDSFVYRLGEVSATEFLEKNPKIDCGFGIHMAYKEWAVDFGKGWKDLAVIELEVDKDDIVVPLYGVGKVRAKKAKMIREVPLEECGLLGKMLAKKKNNN